MVAHSLICEKMITGEQWMIFVRHFTSKSYYRKKYWNRVMIPWMNFYLLTRSRSDTRYGLWVSNGGYCILEVESMFGGGRGDKSIRNMRQFLVSISKIEEEFVLSVWNDFLNRIVQNKGNHTFDTFQIQFWSPLRTTMVDKSVGHWWNATNYLL